ncbi:hypothetical protein BsWGS_07317 [Bradybaena similaris]
MSPIKAFGTVAVMLACFVVIYPRYMHPFVLRAFGMYEPPKKDAEDNMYPPHLKGMHPAASKQAAAADDSRRHMRQSPPHPGMRAAAEMQRQQAQQGSGRGMMGVVLPMYAIGIVLYLVYTLFKVFNKSSNDSWGSRIDTDYTMDGMGLPDDYDGTGEVHNIYTDDRQRKQLEHLLTRIDDKNVSLDEMRMLQKKLEETEAQMCRILNAMQSVHSKVDRVNVPEDSEQPKDKSDDLDPGMNHSEVGEGNGDANAKQVKNIAGETENGRKQHLEVQDEGENSAVNPERLVSGPKNLQQNVVPDDTANGNEQEVECGNQDKGEKLTCAEQAEDTGDEKSEQNTGTKIRHRKGKHDSEQ